MFPSGLARSAALAACVLTACVQVALARAATLNPAKGGGFGLFSTVDKLENRVVFVWALHGPTREIARPVLSPGHCRECEQRARLPDGTRPTKSQRRLLDEAASFPRPSALGRVARSFAPGRLDRGVTAIRVEVWARTYDRETRTAGRVLVASHTMELADAR